MDIVIKAGQLLAALSLLVIIHEFGHFIAARMFGIKVDKFFLFFDAYGFKLFSFKRGDTEYGIGWLPLGGYVKIAGMVDESNDKEFLDQPVQPWEFRSKPVWQRMIVIMGGIIMNVILGILVFSLHTYYYGKEYIPIAEMSSGIKAYPLAQKYGFQTGDKIVSINGKDVKWVEEIADKKLILQKAVAYTIERNGEKKNITLPTNFASEFLDSNGAFIDAPLKYKIGEVENGSPASKAGIVEGDYLLALNGQNVEYFGDLKDVLEKNKGKKVNVEIKRGTETKQLISIVSKKGTLGFKPVFTAKTVKESFAFAESFSLGINEAWHAVADNAKALWKVVSGNLPANKSVHSLIGIANAYGAHWDWNRFWGLTGMLSMVLALMNLLPIPVLDGGYMVFLIIEGIMRRPVSIKVLNIAQTIGFALVVCLMGFAFYNDLVN